MTWSRRSVLTSLAGGSLVIGGCSSAEQSDTPTPGHGTPTAAFTTRTGSPWTETPTGTASDSPDETATETPGPVERALAASRADLETAIDRLSAADVVVDGQVGLVTANAFAEYARTDDPRPVIEEARDRLDFVSDRATGEQQRSVNGLLFLCAYLETRARQHDRIVDGFSSYYQANRAFPEDLKLEPAGKAVGDMRRLRERVRTARTALDRVASRRDALGVAGFDLETERHRQSTVRAIAREFEPAFGGTRSMMRALGLLSATAPAIERGNYEQAGGFASDARAAAGNAIAHLDTAFDRDVRHFQSAFEQDRCLAAGLDSVGEHYVDSARAYRDDRPTDGREHYRAAKDTLAGTEQECGIEL